MCNTSQTGNDLGLTDKNHACSCATDSRGSTARETSTSEDSASTTLASGSSSVVREHYLVEGMTCSHCVASVTEEVSSLDGVDSVSVDLHVGGASRIMVVSARPIPADQVREAITEAGYTMVAG
jgi:copper chaperone